MFDQWKQVAVFGDQTKSKKKPSTWEKLRTEGFPYPLAPN